MEEKNGIKPEDVVSDLESFEVSELDDKDLEEAAGGELPTNTNCGCPKGVEFEGVAGSNNFNCGCGGGGTEQ